MRLTALLAICAGVVFFLASGYLFVVLAGSGWAIEMFDEPDRLLRWVHDHQRSYQGLWLLYFLSQALLLVVPWRLGELLGDRSAGLLGSIAVTIAIVGLVVIVAASPVTARGYHDTGHDPVVLVLHELAADVGKYLRLCSQLLLGVWMVLLGRRLHSLGGGRAWWLFGALGAWTLLVSAWKLFDPLMPLEDWLGFLLGLGYMGLGAGLLRTKLRNAPAQAQH